MFTNETATTWQTNKKGQKKTQRNKCYYSFDKESKQIVIVN